MRFSRLLDLHPSVTEPYSIGDEGNSYTNAEPEELTIEGGENGVKCTMCHIQGTVGSGGNH